MTRHGAGRPYQRSSDGRWIGKASDGRGGHRYVTGTDEATVARRLRELRKTLAPSSSRSTHGERLRDHLERWFVEVAPTRYQGRTAQTNLHQARLHILPMLGRYRLPDLRPSDVQRMLDAMIRHGYAPQTVHNVAHILSVVLKHAKRDGLVDVNVAGSDMVDLPKLERASLPSMSADEVHRFLEATRGEPLWPAWALAFATGVRAGELCGLRWADWDKAAGTLTIDGQYGPGVVRGDALVYPRRPGKTRNARRVLHLPELGVEALRAQQAQAKSAVIVFATPKGHPLNPTYVSRRFRETLVAHGFPHVRLHSLRHSAAVTMLDVLGGDVVAVSKTLGHSTITVTVDTYSQEADAARKRAAAAMDTAMRVTKAKVTG